MEQSYRIPISRTPHASLDLLKEAAALIRARVPEEEGRRQRDFKRALLAVQVAIGLVRRNPNPASWGLRQIITAMSDWPWLAADPPSQGIAAAPPQEAPETAPAPARQSA